jgi:hypothetical protein
MTIAVTDEFFEQSLPASHTVAIMGLPISHFETALQAGLYSGLKDPFS